MNKTGVAAIGAWCALLIAACALAAPAGEPTLNDLYATLASKRFVDLTHTFGPTTPHWKGFGEEKVTTLYSIKKDGFIVQQFTLVGQWGTHKHSFVAMRTDWSKRWPDDAAMQNRDAAGVAHYLGWSKAVLKLLYEERMITASGHETTDTDPGLATTKDDYSLESYILGLNHYQIEMLANLDQVPQAGALVMVSLPKPDAGTGFPARVIAIVP